MSKGRTMNLERLVNDARKRADAIRRDGDLSEEGRARRLAALIEETRPRVEDELDNIEQGYTADLQALREKAQGPSAPAGPQEALVYELRRARVERSMVARWTLVGPPSPQEYEDILASGDDVAAEVFEELAPVYASDDNRYGLRAALEGGKQQRRERGMSPDQKRAESEANSLELERESAVVMGELPGERGTSSREKFVANLLEGRGLRSVHRDGAGWIGTDEAERLDAQEVA